MGIPVFSEIERLITEHGSAAILKERLALAADQYGVLEKKIPIFANENAQLKSENASLRLDLEKAQEKIRDLEEKLIERHGQRLEKVRENILDILSSIDEASATQIAGILHIKEVVVEYHLNELNAGTDPFISASRSVHTPTTWHLNQPGRAYLIKHNLIK